jgi:peptidoglycan hydrolase-like protein with peptidoglycan-binding domain
MSRVGADAVSATVPALRALGATFVCRYLSPPANTWKNLTAAEANALIAGGIDVVSNWEFATSDWQGGGSAGRNFGHQADSMHRACGGPGSAPIYFSVDEDANPADVVNSGYFQGVNSVIGAQRTGAYAGTAVLRALASAGLIAWKWRTMSTDFQGGAGTQAEFNIVQIAPFDEDYDKCIAYTDDFGQWSKHTSTGTPPPVVHPPVNYQYNATHNLRLPVAVDGQFGPRSWAALQYVLGVVTDGDPGPITVGALQHMLARFGLPAKPLPVTGSLDVSTIIAFQEKVGVAKTGVWDRATSQAAQRRLNAGILYGSN